MLSRIEHAMSLTDQLRSLPTAEPRLDGWVDVRSRVAARQTARARRRLGLQLAAAASVAIIAVTAAWRAGTSVPIDTLEAQVQWIDHQISVADGDIEPGSAEQLWRRRVGAMNSLVQLRYVEAQRIDM